MNKENITIVICCAGMGTRLGIGTTKALVKIYGKPLIIRQLELLKDYDDIRIVVGYQADRVIKIANSYRKDIMYAFNYDYENTGVGDSLKRGMIGAREYTVAMDGDVLVNPEDLKKFLEYPDAVIGVCHPCSSDPVFANIENTNVVGFNRTNGEMEWCGIAKMKSDVFMQNQRHVFDMLNKALPVSAMVLRAREMDTQEDYEKMFSWVENGCID